MADNEFWKRENSPSEKVENSGEQIPAISHQNEQETDTSCQGNGKAHSSDKQVPFILDPKNRSVLTSIINQLDPSSFVKLARTCRAMNEVCFRSEDVQVVYNGLMIKIEQDFLYDTRDDIWASVTLGRSRNCLAKPLTECRCWDDECDFHIPTFSSDPAFHPWDLLNSPPNRRRIRDNYPFVFKCEFLWLTRQKLDVGTIPLLRPILDELNVLEISEISAGLPKEWDSFYSFLQDFHVTSLICHEYGLTVSEEILRRLVTSNMKKIHFRFEIPDEMILKSTVPNLILPPMIISEETFKALIMKFVNSNENKKTMKFTCYDGVPSFVDHYNLFETLPGHPRDYGGPEERLPIIFDGDRYGSFSILRKDGSSVCCSIESNRVYDEDDDYESCYSVILEIGASGSDKKIPFVVDQKHRSVLTSIISQLDPRSFVKLARTCRAMNEVCFKSTGIQIVYDHLLMKVSITTQDRLTSVILGRPYGWVHCDCGECDDSLQRTIMYKEYIPTRMKEPTFFEWDFFNSPDNRRLILEKYPFVFKCDQLSFYKERRMRMDDESISILNQLSLYKVQREEDAFQSMDDDSISILSHVLKEFKVLKITEVVVCLDGEWDRFSRFLQDFRVKSLLCDQSDVLTEEMLRHLLTCNVEKLDLRYYIVPDELIFEATVPHVLFRARPITEELFLDLIKKFAYSKEDEKSITLNGYYQNQLPFKINHYNLFETIPCLPGEYDGPIPQRPILFFNDDNREFAILRTDGRFVRCYVKRDCLVFSVVKELCPFVCL